MKVIENLKIKNKKVIIRCDFNVPMKNGVITDDNRIKESLETINYAIEKGAKVILMSHLGRVEKEEDKKDNTLLPVAKHLSELLNRNVLFIPHTRGEVLEDAINRMKTKEVILMENTRFEDIDNKKESNNDPELGTYWASLADFYINDAFGTSHRSHASNVGIATHLKSRVGFLVEKELKHLKLATKNPKKPMTVILGGAKVSDKIGVISNLVNIADYILIGGGMSYTFLKAKGYNIGKSLLDEESIPFCKEMLEKYPNKIILPVDVITTDAIKDDALGYYTNVDGILDDYMGVDIGTDTIELFKGYLKKSKTIVWNGPLGVFEIDTFAVGTKEILDYISKLNAVTIIGGGDTASAAINFGYKDKMTHISTGGGASLELLEGKELPGIKIIK